MAPRTRRGARTSLGRAGRTREASSRNTARPGKRKDDGLADVYKELMHEAGESSRAADYDGDESRPRKRPRMAGQRPQRREEPTEPVLQVPSSPLAPPPLPTQTTIDESESEGELEFEDVELDVGSASDGEGDADVLPEEAKKELEQGFTVTVPANGPKGLPTRARRKRRPVTSAERAVRLTVHKMHVCCLLYHAFYRNHWCNDQVVQAILKPLATNRIVQLLNPDPRASQAQQSTFFLLGLNQIGDIFHARFRITSLGLQRPKWFNEKEDLASFSLPEMSEKPLELADFRRAAQSLQGSVDIGAQLFCALLRAVGVEARLVCSLQVLGFAAAADGVAGSANNTPAKRKVYLQELENVPKVAAESSSTTASTARRIARIGQPRVAAQEPVSHRSATLTDKSPHVDRPAYPVFWVEAFNSAHQRWLPVDPIATHTVGKPSRLEPGINDPKNSMTYVYALEEDGVARDVTRRYTKAFTAKTRKLRVESTENGGSWLRKAQRLFGRRPGVKIDRDALEDAELTARTAKEGMPKNVLDFRNHPLYALERHLRRNEVIHPKVESGRINAGSAMQPRFESVYRRGNVHVVKSAEKWFRLGREVKVGEQPLKYAMPRRQGQRADDEPEGKTEGDGENAGVGLYAVFQTQVYIPPAVGEDGRIPKNQFGNIDIYTPSMIPEGAVWVRLPEAKTAARLLKIDYADAVTGFDFKGRHGTARIDGVVVAETHFEAMENVCEGLRDGREEDTRIERGREALRLWRRFLVGLREVERIEGYVRNAERMEEEEAEREAAAASAEDGEDADAGGGGGGGFVVGDDEHEPERPRPRRNRKSLAEEAGGFFAEVSGDEQEDGSGFVDSRPKRSRRNRKSLAEEAGGFFAEDVGSDSDGGGGFVADSSDGDTGSGGGFIPEEDDALSDDGLPRGGGDGDGGGGFSIPDFDEHDVGEHDDSEHEDDEDAYQDTSTNDTPFGFVGIRIPKLQETPTLDTFRGLNAGLPTFVRGIRPQSRLLANKTVDTEPTDEPLTSNMTGPIVEKNDDAVVLQAGTPPPSEIHEHTMDSKDDADIHDGNDDMGGGFIPEDDDASMHEDSTIKHDSLVDAPPLSLPQPKEEVPMSSYEYDEDMLEEDPEDADAEPEWLV